MYEYPPSTNPNQTGPLARIVFELKPNVSYQIQPKGDEILIQFSLNAKGTAASPAVPASPDDGHAKPSEKEKPDVPVASASATEPATGSEAPADVYESSRPAEGRDRAARRPHELLFPRVQRLGRGLQARRRGRRRDPRLRARSAQSHRAGLERRQHRAPARREYPCQGTHHGSGRRRDRGQAPGSLRTEPPGEHLHHPVQFPEGLASRSGGDARVVSSGGREAAPAGPRRRGKLEPRSGPDALRVSSDRGRPERPVDRSPQRAPAPGRSPMEHPTSGGRRHQRSARAGDRGLDSGSGELSRGPQASGGRGGDAPQSHRPCRRSQQSCVEERRSRSSAGETTGAKR